jgi:hypothetical protein
MSTPTRRRLTPADATATLLRMLARSRDPSVREWARRLLRGGETPTNLPGREAKTPTRKVAP